MRVLVISYDSYSWVKHCAGTIAKNSNEFDVLIITKDDMSTIHNCEFLCKDAIFEQRRYDIFNIGKFLKLKKLSNMMFDSDNINFSKLLITLQLTVLLSGYKMVLFQDIESLNKTIPTIVKNKGILTYKYGNDCINNKTDLDIHTIRKKCSALKMITGYNKPSDKYITPIDTEYFNIIN